MGKESDARLREVSLYFLPLRTRVPLKFGSETMSEATLARARVRIEDRAGRAAEGWGETPLNVQWVWPSALSYQDRHRVLCRFCVGLAGEWERFREQGHPMEVGWDFHEKVLPRFLKAFNEERREREQVPWLAALVCSSPFDIALHDAYGVLQGLPVYQTYNEAFMNRDLAHFLSPARGAAVSFSGLFPQDFLRRPAPTRLPAWHLVGGKDAVDPSELTGSEPDDGYPVLLEDWIKQDGLACLKIKLRGNDAAWDYRRLASVGALGARLGVRWLSADFNCTVTEPSYVTEILDRLLAEKPEIYGMLLYVEQPFPYDLEAYRIDAHAVCARKPLFMDESAHDWRLIRLGRELGWSGVALKTCKTQTGALLSLCWARAHGMTLMVQDLSNPMLAQIPHVLLAANAGTIMGVETNAMQFYPEASRAEAAVHPGLYRRRNGQVDLSTLGGPGFGYRLDRIGRQLPPPQRVPG